MFDETAQTEMFGMTLSHMKKVYNIRVENGVVVCGRFDWTPEMYLISVLSDVQELMYQKDLERARQMTNRVKWMISQITDLQKTIS